MDLHLPTEGLSNYKSASQRARISSESWAARELYCPRCTSNSLDALPGNTPVFDFRCPGCESGFQLKSAASAFRTKLTDGAYAQMHDAILHGRTPNLFLLHYQFNPLTVASLTFIPDFAFTLADVYAAEDSLAQLHPHNAHIRPKIRQQLQVLRDLGLLTFLGSGSYRLD